MVCSGSLHRTNGVGVAQGPHQPCFYQDNALHLENVSPSSSRVSIVLSPFPPSKILPSLATGSLMCSYILRPLNEPQCNERRRALRTHRPPAPRPLFLSTQMSERHHFWPIGYRIPKVLPIQRSLRSFLRLHRSSSYASSEEAPLLYDSKHPPLPDEPVPERENSGRERRWGPPTAHTSTSTPSLGTGSERSVVFQRPRSRSRRTSGHCLVSCHPSHQNLARLVILMTLTLNIIRSIVSFSPVLSHVQS
jgi:hypothetical protein